MTNSDIELKFFYCLVECDISSYWNFSIFHSTNQCKLAISIQTYNTLASDELLIFQLLPAAVPPSEVLSALLTVSCHHGSHQWCKRCHNLHSKSLEWKACKGLVMSPHLECFSSSMLIVIKSTPYSTTSSLHYKQILWVLLLLLLLHLYLSHQ